MKCFFVLVLSLVSLGAMAQKSFTLDDVVPGGKNFYNYYPRYANGSFTLNGDGYVQLVNDSFFVWNQNLERSFLVDLPVIRSIIPQGGTKKSVPLRSLAWINNSQLWLNYNGNYYFIDWQNKSILDSVLILSNAANVDFLPAKNVAAFTVGNDLFVSRKQNRPKQITHSANQWHIYGQVVHRNEFGIEKGTFWSPDASKLAFYFMDESMVTDYPLVDVSTRIAAAKPIKYPMAGMESHRVKVGIYNLTTEQTLYLETGEPEDRFFTNISWTPDGNNLLVAEINRAQNHMMLNLYSAVTGRKIKTLFEEHDDCWIEPTTAALFLKKNPQQFVWQSKRDGYNHLYLYDLNGKLIRQLTKGNWNVTEFYGFDASEHNYYIQSTAEGYLERHVYKVNASNGKSHRLTQAAGTNKALFSANGNLWIDHF